MSRHATFENFGMAFLTLFQVSTGDNWNGIMKVHVVGRGGRVRLGSACPAARRTQGGVQSTETQGDLPTALGHSKEDMRPEWVSVRPECCAGMRAQIRGDRTLPGARDSRHHCSGSRALGLGFTAHHPAPVPWLWPAVQPGLGGDRDEACVPDPRASPLAICRLPLSPVPGAGHAAGLHAR